MTARCEKLIVYFNLDYLQVLPWKKGFSLGEVHYPEPNKTRNWIDSSIDFKTERQNCMTNAKNMHGGLTIWTVSL